MFGNQNFVRIFFVCLFVCLVGWLVGWLFVFGRFQQHVWSKTSTKAVKKKLKVFHCFTLFLNLSSESVSQIGCYLARNSERPFWLLLCTDWLIPNRL